MSFYILQCSALIKRTLFSFAKVTFSALIAKTIPLKNRENQTSFHYCTCVAYLAAAPKKHYPFNPIQFPIIFKPVCWQVCLSACVPAGGSVGTQAGWQDGRQTGLQVSVCIPVFVYCAISLLLHYYIDKRIHCVTDLHQPNSIPLNPHPIADAFI